MPKSHTCIIPHLLHTSEPTPLPHAAAYFLAASIHTYSIHVYNDVDDGERIQSCGDGPCGFRCEWQLHRLAEVQRFSSVSCGLRRSRKPRRSRRTCARRGPNPAWVATWEGEFGRDIVLTGSSLRAAVHHRRGHPLGEGAELKIGPSPSPSTFVHRSTDYKSATPSLCVFHPIWVWGGGGSS